MKTTVLLLAVLGCGLVACGSQDEPSPAGDVQGDMPMADMPGMEGMADTSAMRRHAQEADSMAAVLRQHVAGMRRLSSGQWHERMAEHVGHVSGMLGLMNRQMREMDMGMGMSAEQMGRMMGMSADEHRGMVEAMQAIRSEVEQLQTASREQVSARMPAHLDRLERIVEMMEQSAAHMRSIPRSEPQ